MDEELESNYKCTKCNIDIIKNKHSRKYCESCSVIIASERTAKWNKENPEVRKKRIDKQLEQGKNKNITEKRCITWFADGEPKLSWLVRFSIPHTIALSKNSVRRGKSGCYTPKPTTEAIADVISKTKEVIKDQKVYQTKVWIDLLIQKPHHKGDAINMIDFICDAIKKAIGVDDKWFSIRRLDWEIAKENPKIWIGIGQEINEDCHVCSNCGKINPKSEYTVHRQNKLGVGRICPSCRYTNKKQHFKSLVKSEEIE